MTYWAGLLPPWVRVRGRSESCAESLSLMFRGRRGTLSPVPVRYDVPVLCFRHGSALWSRQLSQCDRAVSGGAEGRYFNEDVKRDGTPGCLST